MMKIVIPKNLRELKQNLNDPLYKNSIFLLLSFIMGAGSGFIFWVFAARFYSAEDIGLASAMISAMMLLLSFSLMGFEFGLAHYLPTNRDDKREMINSCFTIVLLVSLLFAFIFMLGLDIWSPALAFIRGNSILLISFVVFTAAISLSYLQTFGIFVGFRMAQYSFIQSLVTSLRFAILPLLVAFGVYGIFMSYGLVMIFGFIVGLILTSRILPSYIPIPTIKRDIVNEISHFSLGNYFANMLELLPIFILPIFVVNLLGSKSNAYFYIALTISLVLFAIPRYTSLSLLTEGSRDPEQLRRNAFRSLKFIFILLIPAIIGILVFGKYILNFFGEEYAKNSFKILLILCIASIPASFNYIYMAIKRVEEKLKSVIFVFGCGTLFILLGSYLLTQNFGLIGVGIAWFLGNIAMTGIIFLIIIFGR